MPMPYIGGKDNEDINTIPEGFGEPIRPMYADGQRYPNRVPS